eukprot:scaffold108040_cov122-Cyclotella_meneghiniana.AAC.5
MAMANSTSLDGILFNLTILLIILVSVKPSCTPSQAPTPQPSINLFYPDWSSGSFKGCIKAYLDAESAKYMFSTLNTCCLAYLNFAWKFNACMGNPDNTCARALWYPDWEGTNNDCLQDGSEPFSKAGCCDEFYYYYDYSTCMNESSSSSSGTSYYPDWSGDDTCKNDGQAPPYMVGNPTLWLHSTLAECCNTHYFWKSNECIGTTVSASTGLYYPDWSGDDEGCLNDGNEPAFMTQSSNSWVYSTLGSCREEHYSWNLNSCLGTSVSAGSSKWYMDRKESKCVQDYTGSSQCGGLAETWETVSSGCGGIRRGARLERT